MSSQERLITIKEVQHMIGFKDSRIYELIKEGRFPRPIKIGFASRWSLKTVQEWIENHVARTA